MPVLDATLTTQLTQYLTMIREPIELVASLDDSATSDKLAALLDEIAAAGERVTVRRDGTDARRPSFAITRPGTDISVRFAGIPLGHEFTSLVLALLQVGGHPSKTAQETLEQIAALEGEHTFETYMSLSCQNCPDVVQALNLISIVNPKIKHTAIEGGAFQSEIDERKVLAVPTVYLDGEVFGQGRMSLEDILGKLDTGAASREAERLSAKDPFDVLVVGSGPAGASAAIYAARKGIRTGLVGERFGGQVLDTMAIENLVSVPHTEGPKLAADLERHVGEYEVDVVKGQRATRLIPAAGVGADGAPVDGAHPELTVVEFDGGARLSARNVILATGARWRTMGVPGEDELRNKGVTFCPHCDGPLFKGKRVAVIGGGNSGVEAAIDLAGIVAHVTLVEFLDELRADSVLQRKLRSLPNVEIITGAKTTAVTGTDSVTGLDYEVRATGEAKHLDLEGVFVQIGLLPNTDWLAGSVELSERREVVVDTRGATSVPGVFAAGDCTTSPYKQIVTAMGDGSNAALSAFDHLIRTTAPA